MGKTKVHLMINEGDLVTNGESLINLVTNVQVTLWLKLCESFL